MSDEPGDEATSRLAGDPWQTNDTELFTHVSRDEDDEQPMTVASMARVDGERETRTMVVEWESDGETLRRYIGPDAKRTSQEIDQSGADEPDHADWFVAVNATDSNPLDGLNRDTYRARPQDLADGGLPDMFVPASPDGREVHASTGKDRRIRGADRSDSFRPGVEWRDDESYTDRDDEPDTPVQVHWPPETFNEEVSSREGDFAVSIHTPDGEILYGTEESIGKAYEHSEDGLDPDLVLLESGDRPLNEVRQRRESEQKTDRGREIDRLRGHLDGPTMDDIGPIGEATEVRNHEQIRELLQSPERTNSGDGIDY